MTNPIDPGGGERGMMLIMAGLGLVAFMSATMLALDVGMFMVARSQAQNAADAGALAGAVALVFDDYDDKSASGPAVQNAIAAARSGANGVMREAVSVNPDDVTFPTADRVRVQVFRTKARGNPLLPFLAPMFGIDEVDLGATATAEAAPANAMTCVKPFTIPDRWGERQTAPWDPSDDFDHTASPPDYYVPADQPGYTGYNAHRDRGTQVIIKASNDEKLYPSFYFPYSMGGETGAEEYRWNIGHCNDLLMEFGDELTTEPGNMVGPTKQGIGDLIALDPDAYWDSVENKVVSDMSPSPRVVTIPVFDPMVYFSGKKNGRNADLTVANYIGIFVEGFQGNDVMARITPVGGVFKGDGGPAPAGAFPRAIVLVD